MPEVDSPEAKAPHALIIDDLLLFRQVPWVYVDADVNIDHDTDEVEDPLEGLDEAVATLQNIDAVPPPRKRPARGSSVKIDVRGLCGAETLQNIDAMFPSTVATLQKTTRCPP